MTPGLLAGLQRGESFAWKHFWEETGPRLVGLLRVMGLQEHEEELFAQLQARVAKGRLRSLSSPDEANLANLLREASDLAVESALGSGAKVKMKRERLLEAAAGWEGDKLQALAAFLKGYRWDEAARFLGLQAEAVQQFYLEFERTTGLEKRKKQGGDPPYRPRLHPSLRRSLSQAGGECVVLSHLIGQSPQNIMALLQQSLHRKRCLICHYLALTALEWLRAREVAGHPPPSAARDHRPVPIVKTVVLMGILAAVAAAAVLSAPRVIALLRPASSASIPPVDLFSHEGSDGKAQPRFVGAGSELLPFRLTSLGAVSLPGTVSVSVVGSPAARFPKKQSYLPDVGLVAYQVPQGGAANLRLTPLAHDEALRVSTAGPKGIETIGGVAALSFAENRFHIEGYSLIVLERPLEGFGVVSDESLHLVGFVYDGEPTRSKLLIPAAKLREAPDVPLPENPEEIAALHEAFRQYYHGLYLAASGHPRSAQEPLSKAVAAFETPAIQILYAQVLLDSGKDQEAEAYLEQVLETREHPQLHLFLAKVLEAKGDFGRAAEHYEAALLSGAEDPAIHFSLGLAYLLDQNVGKAYEQYLYLGNVSAPHARQLGRLLDILTAPR